MNEWELTDEEIQGIVTGGYAQYAHLGQPECRKAIDRAIARAAQKKLVEWMNDHCDTTMWGKYCNVGDVVFHDDMWQALKEDVK